MHERAILLLERGFQPALHVQQNPSLVGVSSYRSENELVRNRVERNGLTLPTSRAIRPQSLWSERGTRWKARRFRYLVGCGVTASSI